MRSASVKRVLPDAAASTRPTKRTSTSPAHSPSSSSAPPNMSYSSYLGSTYNYFGKEDDSDEDAALLSHDDHNDSNYTLTSPPSYPAHDNDVAMGDRDSASSLNGSHSVYETSAGNPSPEAAAPQLPRALSSTDSAETAQSEDIDVSRLSENERHEFYESIWGKETVELKNLKVPELCLQYPELRKEMFNAYLDNITVTAKVWSNYDSDMGLFYLEQNRLHDCGKIYLSPKQRARLENLDWNKFEISNLRLDIGTPFRTLCHVWITAKQTKLKVGWMPQVQGKVLWDPNGPHRDLCDIIKNGIAVVRDWDGTWNGKNGMTLADLDDMATAFVYEPENKALRYRYCSD